MIKNKFEKFILIMSSFFLAALGVAGIKLKEDGKEINDLANTLNNYSASLSEVLEAQKQIMAERQSTLDKIENAPAPDTTKTITTQTVVPGKVVSKKIPVTASKTTKTS